MKFLLHSVIAVLSLTTILSVWAQNPTQTTGTYLRVVNLLPISSEKVDIFIGDTPYLLGAKSGFIRNYDSAPNGGKFSLRRGETLLDTFELERGENQFYTLVIQSNQGDGVAAQLLSDAAVMPESDEQESTPTEPPPKRLRIYVGSYDFAIEVSAEKIGKWNATSDGLFEEIELGDTVPQTIKVTFIDRYGASVDLFYPTDFSLNREYSVFVSQRARNRPRVAAFPDSVLPADDPESEIADSE